MLTISILHLDSWIHINFWLYREPWSGLALDLILGFSDAYKVLSVPGGSVNVVLMAGIRL